MVASDPIAAIVAGNYVKVPVLSGLTHSESKLLSSFLPLVGRPVGIKFPRCAAVPDPVRRHQGEERRVWRHGHLAHANGAAYDAAIAELDAKFFIALRDNYMNALMAQTPTQIWSYRFDWKQEAAPWNDVYGAAHAFDLPFLFGNFGPSLYANVIGGTANQTGRLALSDAMMSTLAAFARDGKQPQQRHAGRDLAQLAQGAAVRRHADGQADLGAVTGAAPVRAAGSSRRWGARAVG